MMLSMNSIDESVDFLMCKVGVCCRYIYARPPASHSGYRTKKRDRGKRGDNKQTVIKCGERAVAQETRNAGRCNNLDIAIDKSFEHLNIIVHGIQNVVFVFIFFRL